MYKNVTGIILAGGKSTRMGENKALMELGGITVIERMVNLVSGVFDKVILSTNTPEEYGYLNIPMFPDVYKYQGPLAGIHSGLLNSTTENNFIISCDIPLMMRDMISYLLEYPTDKLITVARAEGFIQQLAGKYSKRVVPEIEKLFSESDVEIRDNNQKKRKCKVLSLLEKVGADVIDAESLSFYNENIYLNMNKKEDYQKVVNILGNRI